MNDIDVRTLLRTAVDADTPGVDLDAAERAASRKRSTRRILKLGVAVIAVAALVQVGPGALRLLLGGNFDLVTNDGGGTRIVVHHAPVVVANGGEGDSEWELEAYQSNLGLCFDFYLDGYPDPLAGGCGWSPKATVSYASTGSSEPMYLVGATAPQVARVEGRFSSGVRVHAVTHAAPDDVATDKRFFVLDLTEPDNVPPRLLALRADGTVFARLRLRPLTTSPNANESIGGEG